jgi:peptide/nickel transport system permease protein
VSARLAAAVFALVVAAALVATVWTPWPVDTVAIADRFAPPSLAHPLGTDQYGRDVLSMLMAGAATSLAVAAAAIGIGATLGTAVGLLAASLGGLGETALMRASDLLFAFPALIVAAILAALAGPGALNAVIAIAVFNVPVFARLAAAAARQVLARDFVDVARLAGKGRGRIAAEHVVPNIAPVIVTHAATQFAVAILAEAALSYVGLGAQPPAVSWGRMLAEAQTLVVLAPALAVWPGVAITVTVLCATQIGEALRRQLDPRLARLDP